MNNYIHIKLWIGLLHFHLDIHDDVINGNIFRVTGHFCGEFTGEFPSQRPVARSFDVFFHLCLNKRLNKQSWGWWFETSSRSLWRHCNDYQGGFPVIDCLVKLPWLSISNFVETWIKHQYMALCVFSSSIALVMIARICAFFKYELLAIV